MSVLGQQIQVLCHAYRTLQCMGNQYGTKRNQPCNQVRQVGADRPKLCDVIWENMSHGAKYQI